MKEVKYKCNICLDYYNKEMLFCMEAREGSYLIHTNNDASDKHICPKCIKTITNFGNKTFKAEFLNEK